MGRQVNEREIVLAVLMEITENGAYSHKFSERYCRNINTLRRKSVRLLPG